MEVKGKNGTRYKLAAFKSESASPAALFASLLLILLVMEFSQATKGILIEKKDYKSKINQNLLLFCFLYL